MNKVLRPIAIAAALLALLVGAAGCGSEDDSAADASGDNESSAPASAETSAADHTVTSVVVRRSGGKTGRPAVREFFIDRAPPDGFTEGDRDAVIAAAQDVVDAGVTPPEPPANTCCDRYLYAVTIGFADGSSQTFEALDGERTPAAVAALLSSLS